MSTNQQFAPPGSTLRSAREAKGIEITELADQLNMLVGQLQAIEANDYSKFNAELFVKGHIRSYASFLSLPLDPLLHDAEQHFGVFNKPSKELKSKRVTAMNARIKVGFALMLAVLVWMASVYFLSDSKPEAVKRIPVVKVQTLPADGLAPLRARLSGSAGSDDVIASEVLPLGDFQMTKAKMTLDFKKATWIQVKNAKGERLLNGIQGQDKSVELSGFAPFELIISSWQVVEVGYNGRQLNLEQILTDSTNTARFRVGELEDSQY